MVIVVTGRVGCPPLEVHGVKCSKVYTQLAGPLGSRGPHRPGSLQGWGGLSSSKGPHNSNDVFTQVVLSF